MNMRKITICVLLCALLAGLSMSAGAEWIISELGVFRTVDGVVYWLGSEYAIATRLLDGQESLRIRATLDGLPVYVENRDNLLRANTARELIIEDGVQFQYSLSIWGWKNLERLVIEGDSLELDYFVINDCPRLTDLQLPPCMTSESGYSTDFEINYCQSLRELAIPEGISYMDYCLSDMDALETLILPATMNTVYNQYALARLPSLTEICVAADGAARLEVTDGSLIQREDSLLLYHPVQRGEDTYAIPEGTKRVEWGVFGQDESLRHLLLPDSLTEMPNLPKSLLTLEVSRDHPSFTNVRGALYSKDEKKLYALPPSGFETYTVESGTQAISHQAFDNNQTLRELIFPADIMLEETPGFSRMKSLEEITLPAGIEGLTSYSFYDCESLRSIHIPQGSSHYATVDGVLFSADKSELIHLPASHGTEYTVPEGTQAITSLGDSALLERIVLSSTLTYIDPTVFDGCTALRSIEVAENHPQYTSVDGVLFDASGETLIAFPAGYGATYAVPAGTRAIDDSAFYGNTRLREVTLPASLESIGDSAFAGCSALESISFPFTLQSIGSYAFNYCHALTKVILPKNLPDLGRCAFHDCNGLKELWLPNALDEEADAYTYYDPGEYTDNEAVFVVEENTPAHRWVTRNDVPFRLEGTATSPLSVQQTTMLTAPQSGSIPVYASPEDTAPMAEYSPGTCVRVVEYRDAHARVLLGGESVFVPRDNILQLPYRLEGSPPATGELAAGTRLYAFTSRQAPATSDYPAGTLVDILSADGVWYQIRANGETGYVPSQYVIPAYEHPQGYAALTIAGPDESLPTPLYTAPDAQAPVAAQLYNASILISIRMADGWYYARTLDGLYGFLPMDAVMPLAPVYGHG